MRFICRSVIAVSCVLVFLGSAQAGDPTTSVLPFYNDAYANWKNAGLLSVGGIPNRTTVCATVNPIGGGADDLANIQNAINKCPAGQVVQLGAGTFTISMSEHINLSQGITLRGSGTCTNSSSPYCPTVINVYNGLLAWTGGKCGTSTSNEVGCVSNPAIQVEPAAMVNYYDFGWSKCGHRRWPARPAAPSPWPPTRGGHRRQFRSAIRRPFPPECGC